MAVYAYLRAPLFVELLRLIRRYSRPGCNVVVPCAFKRPAVLAGEYLCGYFLIVPVWPFTLPRPACAVQWIIAAVGAQNSSRY